MKAIVTEMFVDKDDNMICYPVGATIDFDDERIKDLSARKLVKIIEEKPKKTTKKGGAEECLKK